MTDKINTLREEVCRANLDLVKHGLVLFTWGNVSAIDRNEGIVVIKPSGVEYDRMRPEDMALLTLDGRVAEGSLKPSSDTPTHLELYKAFPNIGGIVHTHSTYATAWAQAGHAIPNLGTTHSDYFKEGVPCTRDMTEAEVEGDYEAETGRLIVELFAHANPDYTPSVLVKNHGPFSWGKDAAEAVHNAVVLEEIAKMAYLTQTINPAAGMSPWLVKKHFYRKHGAGAYYGQGK
jgi:L-ribulose-5-phosphate 4-epimerase